MAENRDLSQRDSLDVIKKFIVRDQNIDALVFQPKSGKASSVVISYSAMNRDARYDRWSWFHQRHEAGEDTLFVVFKDDEKLYFLGKSDEPMAVRYKRFLMRYLEVYKLGMDSVYAVGSSMGGYAALYYGFLYGYAGVCVTNPQIDYASTRRHQFYNWESQIRKVGAKFEDLTDFVFRTDGRPRVFIGHSDYPADRSAADRFIAALTEKRVSYFREFAASDDHGSYTLNQNRLFSLIAYWRSEGTAG
jgi:pimeloyl-ACP methyl ester carboxylesterase